MKSFLAKFLFNSFFLVILLEVFFHFLPAPDYPEMRLNKEYGFIQLNPNKKKEGLYTYGRLAEIKATWNVNNQGWNAPFDYLPKSKRKKKMIAMIGDSYVENFYCEHEQKMQSQLQALFQGEYVIYNFGRSGVNFAEYLNLTKYVQDKFQPDLYIYLVQENDLVQSVANIKRDARLPQYRVIDDEVKYVEAKYKLSKLKTLVRKSALLKYIMANFNVKLKLPKFLRKNKKTAKKASEKIDETALKSKVGKFLLEKLKIESKGIPMLFALHPNRGLIYDFDGQKIEQTEELEIVKKLVKQETSNQIQLLDLTNSFLEEYQKNKTPFEFEINWHFNAYGNKVAAGAIHNSFKK